MNSGIKFYSPTHSFFLKIIKRNGLYAFKKAMFFYLVSLICMFSEPLFAQDYTKIRSLEESIKNETNDSLRVINKIKLSRALHRKKHDENEEYVHAQSAIDLALSLKDTILYSKAIDNLGLLHRYHEQFAQALALHSKAYELVENKVTDGVVKMRFANNAGVAARYNQNYDIAITYYLKALKLAEEENNLRNIAISCIGIGNTLVLIPGRETEALEYYQKSLAAEEKRGNSLGIAMNYLSISDFYITQKDFATAREYLRNLLEINGEREDEFGLAITDEYFGISYLAEEKNLEQAISYFNRSLKRFTKLNNKHKQALLLSNLGNTYLKLGDLNLAESYYLNSLDISKDVNHFGLITSNTLNLSEIYERRQRYKAALSYFKTSKHYEDSVNIREQDIKIEALTQEYDLEKKETRIQLLEKDKALQEALLSSQKQKLGRRRLMTVLLGVAFILLLIIFTLQYKNYQNKKKANARLIKEEKAKTKAIYERNLAQSEILITRLRVNPHFLFNSLNAITYLIQSEQNLQAIKYLKIFSRYTRMVLETSKQQVIAIQDELKLAKYYLMLEENRFEEDFNFTIIGEDFKQNEDIFLPPLLLQPFLENAIWHGLLRSPNPKKQLTISISVQDENVQIIIDDNGVGRSIPKKEKVNHTHKSMGMDIISERIALFNKSNFDSELSYNVIDKKDKNNKATGTQIIINIKEVL